MSKIGVLLVTILFAGFPFFLNVKAQEFSIEAEPGESVTLTDEEGDFTEIRIDFNNQVDCDLEILYHKFKPEQLAQLPVDVDDYIYVELESDCSDDDYESAVLTYRVPFGWIEENKIEVNQVYLFNYNESEEKWQRLLTQYDSSDGEDAYYTSLVENFGYFAVASEKLELPEVVEVTPTEVAEIQLPETGAEPEQQSNSGIAYASVGAGVAFIAAALGLAGYYVYGLFKN